MGFDLDFAKRMFDEAHRFVKARMDVREAMEHLLAACEKELPNPEWERFRTLPIDDDVHELAEWLRSAFGEPPASDVNGLWFGIFNPVLQDPVHEGLVVADLNVMGFRVAPENPFPESRRAWLPDDCCAGSKVLGQIYRLAYREQGNGLENDAEYPLCLGFSAAIIRQLIDQLGPALFLGEAPERIVMVGFDEGDYICLGTIRREGLVLSKEPFRVA